LIDVSVGERRVPEAVEEALELCGALGFVLGVRGERWPAAPPTPEIVA
jgi:hypothetical protein